MKPIFIVLVSLGLGLSSFIANNNPTPKSDIPSIEGKIKCCLKIILPTITLKRPKFDCKKGLGFCSKGAYACVLCNFDGTTPDCVKCVSKVASGKAGDIELTFTVDDDKLSLSIPASIKTEPSFKGEDFSIFTIDEPFTIYNNATGAVERVIPQGTYKTTDLGNTIEVAF